MEEGTLSADQALEQIFEVVRGWAEKPENARHLISVLKIPVEYPKVEPKLVNPHVLVKSRTEEEFHSIFVQLTPAQIKTVMRNNKLGENSEFTGMRKEQLLDELYQRARKKAAETDVG